MLTMQLQSLKAGMKYKEQSVFLGGAAYVLLGLKLSIDKYPLRSFLSSRTTKIRSSHLKIGPTLLLSRQKGTTGRGLPPPGPRLGPRVTRLASWRTCCTTAIRTLAGSCSPYTATPPHLLRT